MCKCRRRGTCFVSEKEDPQNMLRERQRREFAAAGSAVVRIVAGIAATAAASAVERRDHGTGVAPVTRKAPTVTAVAVAGVSAAQPCAKTGKQSTGTGGTATVAATAGRHAVVGTDVRRYDGRGYRRYNGVASCDRVAARRKIYFRNVGYGFHNASFQLTVTVNSTTVLSPGLRFLTAKPVSGLSPGCAI